jgi:Leucine-rich repeat (LRR) protein
MPSIKISRFITSTPLSKLKWAVGLLILLGLLGFAGKILYEWWQTTTALDLRLIQQIQASIRRDRPLLWDLQLESPQHYRENVYHRVVELSLTGLGLSTVPEEVWQLQQLQTLNLYNNRLETLPEAIGNLKWLKYLNLEKNQLRELPASLGKLQRLQQLNLQTNQLTELPEELTAIGLGLKWQPQNESEKGIFLADNRLEVPPRDKVEKGMERVALVEYFQRYPREIRGIERAIGKRLPLLEKEEWSLGYRLDENQQVVELILENMGLTKVPKEVWQLRNLQILGLDDNKLTNLPKEIGQLQKLQKLSLSNNLLTNLPKEIGQLPQLLKLVLRRNQLTQLPPEIGNLRQLVNLWLSNNQLTQLPPEISNLRRLGELYMADNQLKELPPEIGKLERLFWLHLSGNQLERLPKEIGNLTGLGFLNLGDNRLTELPKEISSLPLEFKWAVGVNAYGNRGLFLGGNPLQVPPPEVIQQGREAVVKYFQERGK